MTDLPQPARAALGALVGGGADFRAAPVGGDRGARRGAAPRARRAAHRVGQERGLLRRDAAAARRGRRARRCSSRRCSRSCATRSTRPSAAACGAGDDQQRQPRRVGRDRRRASQRDEIDLLLVSPERFANAAFRRDVLPDRRRDASACSWSTRRTASATGVTTSAPTTAASPASSTVAPARRAGALHDRDRERPRRRRHRRPARRRSRRAARPARPREPRARRGRPADAGRSGWRGSPTRIPTLPGHRHRLPLTVADTGASPSGSRARASTRAAYSGARPTDDRGSRSSALLANELKCVVATSALGMGYDKPDLAFVDPLPDARAPPIAYYQQVGRAGRRARPRRRRSLLVGHEDRQIQDYFISTAFPPREQAEEVVALLGRARRLGDARARSRRR